MLSKDTGNFRISLPGSEGSPVSVYKENIMIGRLDTCDIVLDHKSVSRIHASINFRDKKYFLVNLSSSNILTLNGRLLGPQKDDVLAGGDTIQIGPFTILASIDEGSALSLLVQQQLIVEVEAEPVAKAPAGMPDAGDVLKVFWEKRTRQKEDWGTRLRPTEKPKPGKAMFNWRPTRDLKRTWRYGLFVWAFIIVGAIGVFAYFKYPQAYSPKPLTMAHSKVFESSPIAVASNGNSCTTCHTPNAPLENSCVTCHQAEQFHATNTRAHEEAGITCTVCHKEHQGADFDMAATAIESCATCHSDSNKQLYNGKAVATAHGGTYGYPAVNGKWTWKGVYSEVADAIPEINNSATGDKDEQAKLSRHFHTVHTGRLRTPVGLKGDSRGFVSCSTCHNSFEPIDRVTPQQTCAACHTNKAGDTTRDARFKADQANCISCHTQHPYGGNRWSEFLTEDALRRRKDAIAAKILSFRGQ